MAWRAEDIVVVPSSGFVSGVTDPFLYEYKIKCVFLRHTANCI